jgi:hypothetical protein
MAIGPHQIAVRFEAGKFPRPRARCEHDMLGGILRGLTVLGDRDGSPALQLGLAVDHRDLVLSHQALDAIGELARHFARALDDPGEIEAEILAAEAELVQAVQQVPDLGGTQQRFGRNAAPIETDAAEIFAFDDRGLEPKLGAADRADIAARSASDDDDIERFSHDRSPPS